MLTTPAEHRSTPPAESVDSRQTASVDKHYADIDRHPSAPLTYQVYLPSIDRHHINVDRHPSHTLARPTVDISNQANYGQHTLECDAPDPIIYQQAAEGQVSIGKRKKNKLPKHLTIELTNKDLDDSQRGY